MLCFGAMSALATHNQVLQNPDTGEWTLWSGVHAGQKSVSMKIDSSAQAYSTDLSNAAALWGTNISLSTGSSGIGTLEAKVKSDTTASASTSGVLSDNNSHVTAFTITIYPNNFDTYSTGSAVANDVKAITLAHEIGHAYGLHHVTSTSQVMYGTRNSTKTVTNSDIKGMKFCTHACNHGTDSSFSF